MSGTRKFEVYCVNCKRTMKSHVARRNHRDMGHKVKLFKITQMQIIEKIKKSINNG